MKVHRAVRSQKVTNLQLRNLESHLPLAQAVPTNLKSLYQTPALVGKVSEWVYLEIDGFNTYIIVEINLYHLMTNTYMCNQIDPHIVYTRLNCQPVQLP